MRLRQFIALAALTLSAAAARSQAPAADAALTQQPQISSRIPAIAIPALGLETSMAWKSDHDDQTRGWSTGSTNYPIYPDGRNGLSGRQFVASYGDKGGERYHLTFGRDTAATHFIYEANVYLVTPADIANVEMDMNQVLADGRTVIFGTQCSAHSKSWEYTYVDKSGTHWRASNIPCHTETLGPNKWHKIPTHPPRPGGGQVADGRIGFGGVC